MNPKNFLPCGSELRGHEAVEDEVGGAVDEDDDLQDLAERVVAGVEELSAEDEDKPGEILRYPHQFKKLSTTDAENKKINAFMADPIKVKSVITILHCSEYST